FAIGTFYLESVRDTENLQLLQGLLKEAFSADVPLTIRGLEDEGEVAEESLAATSARVFAERVQKIKDDVVADPVVQSATRILGGEIKEIIPLISE
ncbi:MAG: hypothetical protein R3C68_15955, partial [Myxococcota bacterium]